MRSLGRYLQRNFAVLFSYWYCSCCCFRGAHSLSSENLLRRKIPGIWKLSVQGDQRQQGNSMIVEGLVNPNQKKSNGKKRENLLKIGNTMQENYQEALIKIHQDGSFRQCDEGYQEGKWISGRWKLIESGGKPKSQHDSRGNSGASKAMASVLIALDRQYFGPAHDTFLKGKMSSNNPKAPAEETAKYDTGNNCKDDCSSILVVNGTVSIGKFARSKTDPSFFEDPVLASFDATGTFQLMQMLSFSTMISPDDTNEKEDASSQQQRFQ